MKFSRSGSKPEDEAAGSGAHGPPSDDVAARIAYGLRTNSSKTIAEITAFLTLAL
jgi:hypothetical protein